MKHIKKILFTVMLFLLLANVFAQTGVTTTLQDQFDAYRKQALQEKLFVHTDKDVYLAGEILWMKLYDVDAFFHMPLAVSAIAYLEILDKNNKPVLQAKIALNKGDGNGSIYLPVTLNSGNYKLRAYTNWMKNFAPDYFFEKSITIINAQKIPDAAPLQEGIKYDIGFFPEGGNLVSTIQSKVAFRIVDQYGNGVDFEGALIDNNNDTVIKFRPLKCGIGNFSFTPALNHSYKAAIKFPDGKTETKDLPAAYNSGYVMNLSDANKGQVQVAVKQTPQGNQPVYLFVHTRGSVKSILEGRIQNGAANFVVDMNQLGEGVSHFTVFNSEHQPVCERLYFKYPKQNLKLSVHTDKEEYESRKKVNLDIFSGDNDANPKQANMSLAVYRLDSLQKPDESDIKSYLWLISDLGTGIESPAYYFKDESPQAKEAMDNLMLTHGWRRFAWEDILQNKKTAFAFVPEYYGHIISGKIVDNRTSLAGKNIDGYLSVPGKRAQFRYSTSDDDGKIKFEMKDFYGSQEIIVQTNTQKDTAYRIDIMSPFSDKYSKVLLPYFLMPEKNPATLLDESINMQVQNIYAGNKSQQFLMPSIDTNSFYSPADETYKLDSYTRFTTMEEVLREYVPGVLVKRRGGKFYIPVMDKITREPLVNDPLLLIDGVPIFDVDKIMSYDPLKITRLDVLTRRYIIGYTSFDGIVSFISYNGDLAGKELDPHAIVIDYEGLQLQRKFYAPEYETEQEVNSHLPDFRNLLYWEPEAKTNSQGKAMFSFYTSDLPGKYAIMLQGMDAGGLAGSQVMFFDVKGK